MQKATVAVGFHDVGGEEPMSIRHFKAGQVVDHAYYEIRIGGSLTLFMSAARMIELGRLMESHLDVNGDLPEYKPAPQGSPATESAKAVSE